MTYYSPGDEVVYKPRNCGAKVIRAIQDDVNGNEYIVEFDEKDLIPPQMRVPEEHLQPKPLPITLWTSYEPTGKFNAGGCPKCGGQWKETWIGHDPYYDCLKCNLKKEDA